MCVCVCVCVCVCWLSSFEVWGKLENMEVLLINVLLADSIRKQQIILNDLVRRIRKKIVVSQNKKSLVEHVKSYLIWCSNSVS